MIRVLVAEDDEEMLDLVCRVLRDEGYQVLAARDGDQAATQVERGEFDLMVTDVCMPGCGGLELLRKAMARQLRQPVILMTAFGNIQAAVQAMREGAYYYLAKPFDLDDLVSIVGHAAARVSETHGIALPGPDARPTAFPVVFRSAAMGELLRLVREVAPSRATLLVTGGSGTGKEVLARTVHALSPRAARPFVALDCHAIPETLLESELFGHRRGSFTGAVADKKGIVEQAEGGTLFLDEVGNLSLPVQAKLLRFLQQRSFRRVGAVDERSVDVRLVSATNSDLRERVRRGSFREDLYYRLSVIPLRIPELRDRREDIAPLGYHFVRIFNAAGGYRVEGIHPEALAALLRFGWPGNVRQLENVVERAVVLRKEGLIGCDDLPEEIVKGDGPHLAPDQSLDALEREHILRLLAEHGGNQSKVARILGINRRTLYRKLRRCGPEGSEDP